VNLAIVVSLFLLVVGTGSAKAGICPAMTEKQRHAIVHHYKQVYKQYTVDAGWQILPHDPDAQYIVRIYDWPRLVHTIVVLTKNTCAIPYGH